MSNQIYDSLIAIGTFPNFTRDSFASFDEMARIGTSEIDDGHISYCIGSNAHFVYFSKDSNGAELEGEDRWVPLSTLAGNFKGLDELSKKMVHIISDVATLRKEETAANLGLGRLVFVKETDKLYFNTYGLGQESKYNVDGTGWFRELLNAEDLPEILGTVNDTIANISEELNNRVKIGTFDAELSNKVSVDVFDNALKTKVSQVDLDNLLADKVSVGTFDKTVADIYKTIDNITDGDYSEVSNIANSALNAAGATQRNLNDYKKEVANTYASKTELDNYVKDSTFQDEMAATTMRIQKLEKAEDLHKLSADFESYKEEVDKTYAKPEEISSLLNNYFPDKSTENIWIGNDVAGDLFGKTGSEIAKERYSYNDVFDQMFFGEYIPKYTYPSVGVEIKENWDNGSFVNWYDEKNRIILMKAGSLGPDGTDFNPINIKNGVIAYPENLNLGTNLTTGLTTSDTQQKSVGFCKIKDEDGNWTYYKKNGTIYHVPSILPAGEYRYHMVAYFNPGSPVVTNYNYKIFEWKDITPIESEDYITIIASSPTYRNTENGMVENDLIIWSDGDMEDHMDLLPSCCADQAFMTPRKLKTLYIWNGVFGDYAALPMTNDVDDKGVPVDNMVPVYFTETKHENGYYTYRYNSELNGHRGAIKIKVKF